MAFVCQPSDRTFTSLFEAWKPQEMESVHLYVGKISIRLECQHGLVPSRISTPVPISQRNCVSFYLFFTNHDSIYIGYYIQGEYIYHTRSNQHTLGFISLNTINVMYWLNSNLYYTNNTINTVKDDLQPILSMVWMQSIKFSREFETQGFI